jgi:hypothetical protein
MNPGCAVVFLRMAALTSAKPGLGCYALRGGNCPDWIVPSGMQRESRAAGGNPTGQIPPRKT